MAACIAVGLFAVTYGIVRASCESKPYAADVLVSTIIVLAATRWITVPNSMRRCATLTIAISAGLWLSFPAVFVACGVAAATLVQALRARCARVLGYWAASQALVTASAAMCWFVFLSAQTAQTEGTYLENFWQQRGAFPPLGSIGGFLGWLIAVHCGSMFAYPQGGNTFGSIATTLLFVIGLIAFLRTRRAHIALIVVGALTANLIAAGAQVYPYGTAIRIALYLAPLICLTVGQGGQAVLIWFAQRSRKPAPLGAVACILLAFAALGAARDLMTPYKHVDYFNNRAAIQDIVGRAQPADVFVVVNHDGKMGRRPIPAHQVMRYYLELLSGRSAIYPDGGSVPTDARWVLRYTGYDSPSEQETLAAMANAGLELVERREFSLGDRWDTRIIAYEGAPNGPDRTPRVE